MTDHVIDSFSGPHAFLSNFWPCEIQWEGAWYFSTEAAFQADKTTDLEYRKHIQCAKDPAAAKRLGRKAQLRPDWESRKFDTMLALLRLKFQDPHLKGLLLDTGDTTLVEKNHWKDTIWGVCNGVGQNMLGKLLMQVRDEIKAYPSTP